MLNCRATVRREGHVAMVSPVSRSYCSTVHAKRADRCEDTDAWEDGNGSVAAGAATTAASVGERDAGLVDAVAVALDVSVSSLLRAGSTGLVLSRPAVPGGASASRLIADG